MTTSISTRLRWALIYAVLLGLVVALAIVIKPRVPNSTAIDVKVGLREVCPVATEAEGTEVLALANTMGVSVQEIGPEPERKGLQPKTITTISKPKTSLQFQVQSGGNGAALSMTTHPQGLDRGLALARCQRALTSTWFTGIGSSSTQVTVLSLVNLDSQEADVDLSFYGANGRIIAQGGRSIVVRPNQTKTVALEPLFTSDTPVSVQVLTTQGRVAAFARSKILNPGQASGNGVDWVPPSVEPAKVIDIGGIPGRGNGMLTIVNPNERPTKAVVEALGKNGKFVPTGVGEISINRDATLVVDIAAALGNEAIALRIKSELPISGSVIVAPKDGDLAVTPAAEEFSGRARYPLNLAGKGEAQLILSNVEDSEQTVQVVVQDQDNVALPEGTKDVKIPPKTTITVPVLRAPAAQVIDVLTAKKHAVLGGILVQQDTGGIKGMALLPLVNTSTDQTKSDPIDDHLVGR